MISDVVEINLLETRQVGKYLVQVRQQDAYTTNAGVQLKLCAKSRRPFS